MCCLVLIHKADVWLKQIIQIWMLFSFSGCLALPKLNLQFLTLHDYLLRNFNLFRLESTYEIRQDIEDSVSRMKPWLVNGFHLQWRDANSDWRTSVRNLTCVIRNNISVVKMPFKIWDIYSVRSSWMWIRYIQSAKIENMYLGRWKWGGG